MTFDILNFKGTILWSSVTPGYIHQHNPHNPLSGTWEPEKTTDVYITGHISDITREEIQFLPEGTTLDGAILLSTESTLSTNDRITLTNVDSTVSYWYVLRKKDTNNVLQSLTGITRNHYYLIKQK